MSGLEIERKFLVKKGGGYRAAAHAVYHIRQGYIPCEDATVRIRLRTTGQLLPDGSFSPVADEAFLTIKDKSRDGGLSRYEFEKPITRDEAEHLLLICRGGLIDKHRYLVKSPDGRHTFEVDEFHGNNDGLVMAEVELASSGESFEKPDFIGREVTGDRRFYNKHMLRYPYCLWRDSVEE